MKVNRLTRSALRCRRDERDMTANGWERVDERGGQLWELHRGRRMGYVITDVRIAADGISLWIKTKDVGSRLFGDQY